MRVIVCGGRDYSNRAALFATLSSIHATRPIRHLFHGNARGADTLAGEWGNAQSGLSVHPVPADWKKHGKAAGPIRNQNMLGQKPDLVVAFAGGRGTADMIKRSRAAGVEVVEIDCGTRVAE